MKTKTDLPLLALSPTGNNTQVWVRPKPVARSFFKVSHTRAEVQLLGANLIYLLRHRHRVLHQKWMAGT